jgi:hypothetical protein
LLEEAAKYAQEAINKQVPLMRNDAGDVPYSEQRKASQWIAEMSMGKPLQAVDLGMEQSEHKTLSVSRSIADLPFLVFSKCQCDPVISAIAFFAIRRFWHCNREPKTLSGKKCEIQDQSVNN